MGELIFPISRLRPSDTPRVDSWITANERAKNLNTSVPLELQHIDTHLYQIGEILTVPERNHLLAALLFLAGDVELTATPLDARHYNPWQWGYQLQRVEGQGIKTFYDFIETANEMLHTKQT